MGMVEGSTLAMGQLDRVLEGLRAYAAGKGTQTEILDDTHVRITRLIDGPRELVWRAHTEPELMTQWLLGPDGWRMTVCEIDPSAGGSTATPGSRSRASRGSRSGSTGRPCSRSPGARRDDRAHDRDRLPVDAE